MFLNSELLPTALVLSDTSHFIIKISWTLILNSCRKKSDSPDEDKSVHDSKFLIPTLKDFFLKHPLINPKTFLGDAAFDTVELYKLLLNGDIFSTNKHFSKAYIPLNARSGLENPDYTINENGVPCCPKDASLPMIYEGTSKLRSGVTRYKFVCPKIKWVYNKTTQKCHRQCFCEYPCTDSKCGRMVYLYPEKTFALILVLFAEQRNGITLIKSGLSLNVISII